MSNCNNKIKHNCGTITYSTCVRYESGVSNNSELTEGCLSLEETTLDIYNQLDVIDGKIDVSELTSSCITLIEPKIIKSVLQQVLNKICELEDTIDTQEGLIETLQAQVAELQSNTCP